MNDNVAEFKKKYDDFNNSIELQNKSRKLPIFKKRFRGYNPDQITFYTFNPLEAFPKGCFERFIVDTIKNIDISDFEKRKTYDLGGPDEINPKTMLAIIFYGESDGIFSSRDLICLSQSSVCSGLPMAFLLDSTKRYRMISCITSLKLPKIESGELYPIPCEPKTALKYAKSSE